jgi:hypothetical protein
MTTRESLRLASVPWPTPTTPTVSPRERLHAAIEALRASRDDRTRSGMDRIRDAADSAMATRAPVVGSLLERTPTPGRIRKLAEAPETALVAGGAAALSTLVPRTAPVVGTAARAIEKVIDHARDHDSDGRTR